MTQAPAFRGQPITHIDVASGLPEPESWIASLDQAAISDESYTIGLVRQIWPEPVIEYVVLDGFDGGR